MPGINGRGDQIVVEGLVSQAIASRLGSECKLGLAESRAFRGIPSAVKTTLVHRLTEARGGRVVPLSGRPNKVFVKSEP